MRRVKTIPFGAVFVALCASTVSAQTGPVISGQVLAADSDAPLRRARIVVTARPWASEPVLTDNDGRFRVEVPATGPVPFTVTVQKGGYVTAAARMERAAIQAPLLMRLVRGASVSGVVVDQSGAPSVGITVTAKRVSSSTADDGLPAEYSSSTDDLGEYRLAGLARGRYEIWAGLSSRIVVQVAPPAGAPKSEPVTREVGGGAKSVIDVNTAEQIGGVSLVAPEENAADAALRALRAAGAVPSDALIGLISGQRGVVIGPPPGPAPRQGAAIRGRVLSPTRTPVAGAAVRIEGTGTDQLLRTDAAGAFSISGLRPGQYVLRANADGHMEWHYGQGSPGLAGRPIRLAENQVIESVEIVLPPGRAISGVVVDENGEPLQGARLQALQLRYTGGRLVAAPAGSPRSTDDRGRYRLWGLQSGTYLVSAMVDGLVPAGRGLAAYAPIYFPGTPIVGAAVAVDLREDATANLAFTGTQLAEVRGIARDGDGPLVSGTARLVNSRRSGAVSAVAYAASIQLDGSFVLRNVPPGEYVLQVRGDGPGRTGLYGTEELTVGTESMTVSVKTSYGTDLEGRIIFEGPIEQACAPAELRTGIANMNCQRSVRPRIGAVPLDDRSRDVPSGLVVTDSDFFITNLFGLTSFAIQGSQGNDWYLKSFTINGTDIADTGFDFGAQRDSIQGSEVVLSRNGAAVSGRAGTAVRAADDYFVVVFPAARTLRFPQSRRVKFVRSEETGAFRVSGLPPGDYFVAAVSRLLGTPEDGEWQDPEVLLQLEPRAERITLAEGQQATVSLRLIER